MVSLSGATKTKKPQQTLESRTMAPSFRKSPQYLVFLSEARLWSTYFYISTFSVVIRLYANCPRSLLSQGS